MNLDSETSNDEGPPSFSSPNISVNRPALTIKRKELEYIYEEPQKKSIKDKVLSKMKSKVKCSGQRAKKHLLLRLPILKWILEYDLRRDFTGDVISGITVAVMHIPQGMAYGLLAGLDPINGIYMAFYPVLIYAIFGTSRHCSFGTFAVVSIMVSKVVYQLSTPKTIDDDTFSMLNDTANATTVDHTPVEVATIVSFAVGVWMLIFAIFQLGTLSVFLSDMLVSGFMTGATCHVFTSQVKHMLGISIATYSGPFKLMKSWRDIFYQLPNTNLITVVVSAICFIVLIVNNELLKPRLKKYTNIPMPIELLAVILSTVAAKYLNLNAIYDVIIVGDIPTGLPDPSTPPFDLFGQVVLDSLIIAIVAFSISLSMAKILANKANYAINATQELYAQSLSNFVGSLFSCAPVCVSMSRSLIQEDVGGKTQMASLVCCSLLLMILLYIGPFFETLPNSVLGCIITVALKGMFLKVFDFIKMLKISKLDAAVWMITFISVIVIDIDYGLFVGIFASLLTLLLRNQTPEVDLLGRVPDSELYLDIQRYSKAKEIPGIRICKISGNLHFANAESTKTKVIATSELDPRKIIKYRKKADKQRVKHVQKSEVEDIKFDGSEGSSQQFKRDDKSTNYSYSQDIFEDGMNISKKDDDRSLKQNKYSYTQAHQRKDDIETITSEQLSRKGPSMKSSIVPIPEIKWLILELSGISHIDVSASRNLVQMNKAYGEAGIKLVFTGLSEHILELMRNNGTLKQLPEDLLFHTVLDAVATLLS